VTDDAVWQARDVILSADEPITGFEGRSIGGVDGTASGQSYCLMTNFGWKMRLACLQWESGEREMRALDCDARAHRMHDMCNRLRMSVYAVDGSPGFSWMELSQARLIAETDPIRTTKKKASEAEIMEGAGGIAPRAAFARIGAKFGTREELLGDTGRRRSYLCALFPIESAAVPAVAFTLSRVLPVWNRYGV